jgi:hypothetical protein
MIRPLHRVTYVDHGQRVEKTHDRDRLMPSRRGDDFPNPNRDGIPRCFVFVGMPFIGVCEQRSAFFSSLLVIESLVMRKRIGP